MSIPGSQWLGLNGVQLHGPNQLRLYRPTLGVSEGKRWLNMVEPSFDLLFMVNSASKSGLPSNLTKPGFVGFCHPL